MVQADTQIMTYNRDGVAAAATLSAEADAVAQFDLRRGLRFSADARAHTEAHLQAALGSDPDHASLVAAVQASLGVSTRLALAAQLDVHGLFAEACAAGEARARVQGDITVTGQMLLDALGADPARRGLMAPVAAFLREVQLNGGVYAEAYFAVRGRARMMASGSVIPYSADSDHAAFTVAFDYGYAYIWGAGFSGFLDVGVPDVPKAVGATVDAAVTEILRLLPPGAPDQLEPLLRMLVPLSAAAAVAIGKVLGKPQTGEPGPAPSVGDLAGAFLTEFRSSALKISLTPVVEAGAKKAGELINDALGGSVLTDALRADGLAACDTARLVLTELAAAESLAEALPPSMALCDALATFCTDAAPEVPELADVGEALTVAGAAAGTLYQLLGYQTSPVLPDGLVRRVRAATGATGPVTAGHLVEYVGERLAAVLGGRPLGTTSWISDIVGGTAPDLVTLLWHLLDDTSDPQAERALAAKAIEAVVDKVKTHLRPFVETLPAGDLKAIALSIDPLLDVLETALLPLLTDPGQPNPTRAARVRDELDALLTGVFGAMVLRCMDVVIGPFFDRAPQQLRDLADAVDRHDPAFAEFFALANQFDVVFRITEPIVSAALRETAAMIGIANDTAFAGAVELLETFVLLPADTSKRRAELAVLAGTDDPPGGDARLREELLDALFVKSSRFAVEMVPPSIRMTSLIALDQGPVPLVTLFHDVEQIGRATVSAIEDAAQTAGDIGDIVGGIIASGKVSAAQLAQLGTDLNALIGDAAGLLDDILDVVKTLSWPVFVTSTGGIGFFLRAQFDAFFDDADWLVDEIRDRLQRFVDIMVAAMVAIAQDLAVLDTGAGDDLGTLGRAVRQDALGDPAQPGLDLLGGRARLSHAKVAAIVTDATLSRADVRDKVRDFHTHAAAQAQRAQKVQLLLAPGAADAKAAEAAMRATLAAQQRDTGFAFHVTVEGIDDHAVRPSGSTVDVVIDGAGLEFVSGPHPQVRVEIGGHPVAIDPAGWWIDQKGSLRGRFAVWADPLLGAPHPFAAEGVLSAAPPAGDVAPVAAAPGVAAAQPPRSAAMSPELSAIRAIEQQHAAFAAGTPTGFLTRSALQNAAKPPVRPTATDFLPPALQDPDRALTFPAVLQLDRPAMLAAAPSSAVAGAIANLPGTSELAYVSASQLEGLLDGGSTTSVSAAGAGTDSSDLASLVRSAAAFSTSAHPPVSIAVRARPGYTAVTATVCAVPKAGQDRATTPTAQATPDWFALQGEVEEGKDPEHSDAAFVGQDHVPAVMRRGGTQQVTVTMRNTGNTTWSDVGGYRLGAYLPPGNDVWGITWVPVPAPVPPQAVIGFTFTVKSPSALRSVFQWRMVREDPTRGREWFGAETDAVAVNLIWDDAAFVSDSVPAAVVEGTSTTVTVTMINSGTTTWTAGAGYQLGARGYDFGAARHPLTSPVSPGQQVSFIFPITAPPGPSATFQWQMLAGSDWFGGMTPSRQVERKAAPRKVTVPNVVHADRIDATTAIRTAGLVARFRGLTGQDAWVGSQEPVAGTVVNEGSAVVCIMQKAPLPPP